MTEDEASVVGFFDERVTGFGEHEREVRTFDKPHLSVTQYAASVLREEILSGRRPLGARLDQRKLADELGVSVIPVREGLRILDGEGLVRIYPQRGAFVATLSPTELHEIFLIRQELDPFATRMAVPQMLGPTLENLARILEEMEQQTARSQFDALHRLNRDFHLTIYSEARMPILLQLITSLRDRYGVYSRLCIRLPEYSERSLSDHREIYEACCSGDAERTAMLMRAHLEFAAERLLEYIGEQGDGVSKDRS